MWRSSACTRSPCLGRTPPGTSGAIPSSSAGQEEEEEVEEEEKRPRRRRPHPSSSQQQQAARTVIAPAFCSVRLYRNIGIRVWLRRRRFRIPKGAAFSRLGLPPGMPSSAGPACTRQLCSQRPIPPRVCMNVNAGGSLSGFFVARKIQTRSGDEKAAQTPKNSHFIWRLRRLVRVQKDELATWCGAAVAPVRRAGPGRL